MATSLAGAYERLGQARAKGIDPSLEPVRAMLCELGSPERSYDAIQIVGTNGKTSTARYLAAILHGEGKKVGLFTSPCLVEYLDQVEVDGATVDEASFAKAVNDAFEAGFALNRQRISNAQDPLPLTEFDLLTVAALLVFARKGAEVVVLEAGMGGAWDATSAVESICVVGATGVALDHTRMLGSTLSQIAQNKAAVIRRGRKCVLAPAIDDVPEVREVFSARCAQAGVVPVQVLPSQNTKATTACNLTQKERRTATYEVLSTPLHLGDALRLRVSTNTVIYDNIEAIRPAYQAQNIACAIVLAEQYLSYPLEVHELRKSVRRCPTPGRFDVLCTDPLVLLDACHNPQSVDAFVGELDRMEPCVKRRPTLLCAIFADKDVRSMVAMLARAFVRVIVCRTSSPRCMEPHELAHVFEECGRSPLAVYDTVEDALRALDGTPFVACGSITTAGEVYRILAHKGRES